MSRNLTLLRLGILVLMASAGPHNFFQKYLNLRISSLQVEGSVPQNKRTFAGLVDRGSCLESSVIGSAGVPISWRNCEHVLAPKIQYKKNTRP